MTTPPAKKRRSPFKLILILLLCFPLAIAVFSWYWYQRQLQPVHEMASSPMVFVVAKGEGIEQIGANLEAANLINSGFVFKLTVARMGIGQQIQAGTFRLSPSMSTSEVAQSLTEGGSLDFWITVLEGWRREEIGDYLQKAYEAEGIDFDMQTYMDLTDGLEGFLFPDTYLLPVTATEETAVNLMRQTFDKKVTDNLLNDISSSGRSLEEVVTMASLIEREANTDKARQMVSGILWKRLNNDWPLQVDATLQYANGYSAQSASWWKTPVGADKDVVSTYNTYQNQGLPPGPICSPSLSSIEAATYPIESNYWYYITGNDGNMYYAETLDQHNQNIQQYLR